MSCRVIRNENNQITKVNDSQNRESSLFNSIVSHPLVKDSELALNIYKNTFLPKIGENAQWLHKTGDIFTPDYKTALQESEIGQEIEIGFINEKGEFFPIVKTVKNTNKDTYEGFLNSYIENGILSPKKNIDGTYEAHGKNDLQKAINTEILSNDSKLYLGKEGVKKDGDTFTFEKTKGTLKLEKKDGTTERIKYEDVDQMPDNQIFTTFADPEIVILDRELYRQQAAYRDTKFENNIPTRTEKELQVALLNLLSKLGVKTLSISDYISKYQTKKGVAPSATALADIANQVVAYSQGEISLQDLTEETSHFIVEAMPKGQTENILRNIHRTEEWTQFSDQYRELYRKDYGAEELEEVVRREVLGKVVKNTIESNFSTENKTGTQTSIVNRVKELLQEFFDNVRNIFKPQYKTELESYLSDIEAIVQNQDVSPLDTDNFKYNKFRLYSAPESGTQSTKVKKAAQRIIRGLEANYRALSKSAPTATNKRKLEKAQEELKDTTSLSAIVDIVEMSKNKIKFIKAALSDSEQNNKSYALSSEEVSVMTTLKNVIGPSLKELQALTTKEQLNKANIKDTDNWQILNSEISETLSDLSLLEGQVSEKKSQNMERIIDEIVAKYDFPAETKENLMKWAENAESDTSFMYYLGGSLANGKDGNLSVLHHLVRKLHTQSDISYIPSAQQMQKKLRDLGFDESFFKNYMLDGDFIMSPHNFNELQKDLDTIFVNTYKQVVGTELSSEEIIKKRNKGNLDIPFDKQIEFKEKKREAEIPLRERPMIQDYYDQYDEISEKANTSEITKRVLGDYLADMSLLRKKATRSDGVRDFFTLSKSQQEEWKNLNSTRKEYKKILDKTGKLKKGLKYVFDDSGAILRADNGKPVVELTENPSEAAQIAFDIINLDNILREENAKKDKVEKGLPKKFLEDLQRTENEHGREKAIEFLYANAYVNMSSEFWESQNSDLSLLDRLKNEGEVDLYNDILKKKTYINDILKEYSKKNQPSEVEGTDLPSITKDSIKQAQEELEVLYNQAKKALPKEDASESAFSSSANESYTDHISAIGITSAEDEYSEAKEHMTADKQKYVKDFITQIDSFERGITNSLPKRARETFELWKEDRVAFGKKFIERLNNGENFSQEERAKIEKESVSREELFEIIKKTAIRQSLLPYYKRYTSENYNQFSESIRESEQSIADLVKGAKDNNVEVTPNYSFYDNTENDMVNPNYNSDFKGGYFQPNQKYRNEEFYKKFPEGSKEKQAYNMIMEWYEKGLDAGQLLKGYNIYQKPQVRKGFNERWSDLAKNPKSMALSAREALRFSDDDMVSGDVSMGSDIKVIPKRFIYKVEDPQDVSNELFYSMNLMVQEAYLREARLDAYGDIMTVMDTLKQDDRYTNLDKKAESTNTYKLAKNYIDSSLFSIQEEVIYKVTNPFNGKKIDLTKAVKVIINFVKFRNLAFSPIIALTSMFSASATRASEGLIGQFLDVRAQKLAAREYTKLFPKTVSEFGKINTTSKINVLGQQLGAFSIEETFQNSNYGKLGRLIPKLSMGIHSLSNHPTYSKVFLGVLFDNRIIDGKMTTWNVYKNNQKKLGVSKKEARAVWDANENEAVYNYIDVVDGQMTVNDEALSSKMDNYTRLDFVDRIRGQVSSINERVDGQRNNNFKTVMQRDFRLNIFNTHKSWLQIALENTFKSKSLNLDTGQVESGTLTTAADYLKGYSKIVRETGKGNILKAFKQAYEEADDADKSNIKRLGIQMAVMNSILLIGAMLRGDDEDEHSYGRVAANLMLARLGNELNSVSLALPKSVWDTLKDPFVGLGLLESVANIDESFDSEVISRGSYKNLTKGQRYWLKVTPGAKTVYDLSNTQRLNNNLNTYLYFNKGTIEGPIYAPLNHFIIKNAMAEE